MQRVGLGSGGLRGDGDVALVLSATDLSNHLACRHLTALDLMAAQGRRAPPSWRAPHLEVLRARGLEHERAYVAHLAEMGLAIERIPDGFSTEAAAARTVAAMREGAQVIVQATLLEGRWMGRADVLRRVERASDLGPWSYEVVDTKLARETRGGTILQLCLYSDLVRAVQGMLPERMHVVPPRPDFLPDTYRLHDYLAYYRAVKRRLEATVDRIAEAPEAAATYPEPVPHCEVCRWWPSCDARRRADDHLSFVAGITRLQQREFRARDVGTLARLARQAVPIPWNPSRGSREGYERAADQARVQFAGRTRGEPIHELLPREAGRGLARLPAPGAGDMFLDLEGDPYAAEGGLEYLFGYATLEEDGVLRYRARWANDRAEERDGFERTVDEIMARWEKHPDLHVYHFAPYEPVALKRLMGRYASREGEIDRLLRGGRFVDLYAVVRQSLQASVERYSIKDLEPFFGYRREQSLDGARDALRAAEAALELGQPGLLTAELRRVVEAYNRDDCVSTHDLRDWLERIRAGLERDGEIVPRPEATSGDPASAVEERDQRVADLMALLLRRVPDERGLRGPEEQARWLLAHMLDWHRRENKVAWWEYFRLRELTDEELLDEHEAIAGLTFEGEAGKVKRSTIHRYRFPRQETNLREGDELRSREMHTVGEVVGVDLVEGVLDVKKQGKALAHHPTSVFRSTVIPERVLADSLWGIGEWVAEHGLEGRGPHRAARDLLLARPPRIAGGGALERPGEDPVVAACRLALALDHTVFPIQGPPGSGKTYTGARMIVELVGAGKKVGVCAVSHKVIRQLLETVAAQGAERGLEIRCVRKVKGESGPASPIEEVTDNAKAAEAIHGASTVVGGTAWLWARPELRERLDVLFVDEAGQMSLANVLAIASSAASLVLLGDPRQLEQPQQGSHPEGTEVSALEHVLMGEQTIQPGRGLFLPETRRLHPRLCAFTSELFYEGRLKAASGLERQALRGSRLLTETGLWLLPVEHEGNQSASAEEVEAVGWLVESLLAEGARWVDDRGGEKRLTLDDILIVSPYNAQVADLGVRVRGARVGTVDRFQGQQAPVVVYSLATSTPEDAPRGMEFLYDLNRFNVATSRARCACVLVGSPKLFEPECQTPRQMMLANALCRYQEVARVVEWVGRDSVDAAR